MRGYDDWLMSGEPGNQSDDELVEIDLSEWTRRREVLAYAERHQIPVAEAIMRLVNSGLSHLREAPL